MLTCKNLKLNLKFKLLDEKCSKKLIKLSFYLFRYLLVLLLLFVYVDKVYT